MEEGTLFGIDLEVWNNMPVMKQIETIEKNTSNTDQTMKAILEELQKEEPVEVPVETVETIIEVPVDQPETVEEVPQEEPIEETVELPKEETVEEPVEETKEEPKEEVKVAEETVEEEPVEEVPVEEPIDYQQLIYEELKHSNEIADEQHTAVMEQLTLIEEHGLYSNETDGMLGMYLTWIVPFLLVVVLLSKMINPFTR